MSYMSNKGRARSLAEEGQLSLITTAVTTQGLE